MRNNDKARIAILLQQGYGYKKIASELGLNVNTVKSHIQRFHKNADYRLKCEQCGKLFTQGTKNKARRFCSDACRAKWWNNNEEKRDRQTGELIICKYCGKEFRDAKSKKNNTVRKIVMQKPGEFILKQKGKNLTPAQHRAKRNYQICLRIVCALHANGLLTAKELAAVKRRLLIKYDSILGTLYEETKDGDTL